MSFSILASLVQDAVKGTMGTVGTYTPTSGPSISITGVFDKAYISVSMSDGINVEAVHPVFFVKLSDFVARPKSLETVVLNSVTYKIVEVQDDGQGGAILVLNK